MVLAFSLNSHIAVIEAFDHGDSDIQHDVSEEHGGDDEGDEEENFIPLIEP